MPLPLPTTAKRKFAALSDRLRLGAAARAVEKHAPPARPVPPVVFFNASTRIWGLSQNAAFQLLTAWSLRMQGVPVVQFACNGGLTRCVLAAALETEGEIAEMPCRACTAQSKRLYRGFLPWWFDFQPDPALENALAEAASSAAGAPLDALRRFSFQNVPLGELVLPSLRWALRRHHLQNDERTLGLYRDFIRSAWRVYTEFTRLLEKVEPRAVVVFNGQFYPEAAARLAARRLGIPSITHEVGLRPFTAFFTRGEATAYPIHIPEDFELTPEQDARLNKYLSRRFQGDFTMAGIKFWPEMRGLSDEFLQFAAKFRGIVPVFTNVIFDTSQPHANTLYPDMFAWLDEVLEVAAAHPDVLFVIRAHPDEHRPGKAARESVRDWAQMREISRFPNIRFVDSDEYLSSYDLIRRAKFVLVYNSTIGLEATLLGKAVLSAGRARFTQYPTVYYPPTRAAYRQMLEEFLAREGEIPAPEEHRRHARRFLYYQLYKVSLPFGDFLQPSALPGQVTLRPFQPADLLPENSPTFRVLSAGILEGKEFVLDD